MNYGVYGLQEEIRRAVEAAEKLRIYDARTLREADRAAREMALSMDRSSALLTDQAYHEAKWFASLRERLLLEDLRSDAHAMRNMVVATARQVDTFNRIDQQFAAEVSRYIASIREIDSVLQLTRFNWAVREDFTAVLAGVRDDLLRPGSALLAVHDNAGLLTWGQLKSDLPELAGAAWLAEAPAHSAGLVVERVAINCHAYCAFCGTLLIPESEERFLVSTHELEIALKLNPFCPGCLALVYEDPDWLSDNLDRLSSERASKLRLVRGDGEGSTPPRGRDILRLIKDDGDFEE